MNSNFQEALSTIKVGSSSFVVPHHFGHPSAKILSLLKGKKVIDGTTWQNESSICASCQSRKNCKHLSTWLIIFSNDPLQKLHCDFTNFHCLKTNFSVLCYLYRWLLRFTWSYPLRKKFWFLLLLHKLPETCRKSIW